MQIKCFEPDLDSRDILSLEACLQSKQLAFGDLVIRFENAYKKHSNKKYNIGMSSASAAAYAIFAYLYETMGPCDVYTPFLGFVSPAWAAKKNGHNVIFTDVNDKLLFDSESYLRSRGDVPLTHKSRPIVVMPVLYGGVSEISDLDLVGDEIVVVDSAHCISPKIESDFVFFSFHPVKPICMSNGGLLATNDEQSAEFFRKYRNFGRETQGDSYDIVQDGFNFYMNNLNASLGLSQLSKCFNNVKKRKENYIFLRDNINTKLGSFVGHDLDSSFYLSTMVLNPGYSSKNIREYLSKKGIQASFHYPFLHKTKLFGRDEFIESAKKFDDKILNLPVHQSLTGADIDIIIEYLNDYTG